ncbi:MAG: hypothetical protein Kow00105_00850 [Phycisphaeraceae bacterium]
MSEYVNRHGRKPGRGVRPWILIPKVLSVAALFGGFLAASVLLHTHHPASLEDWGHLIEMVSTVFRRLIVPAVLLVVVFGVLLLWQHWRVFLTMRWVQLKLVLLLLTVPPLHLTGRWLIGQARDALAGGDLDRVVTLMFWFTVTADLAVLALAVVIFIGRHKPRLGQWPKPQRQKPTTPPEPDSESNTSR